MNMFFATMIASFVSSFSVTSTNICSSSNALVKDLQVLTTPENPIIGQDYNLTLTFTTPADIIDGATQKIKATFDGFPVTNEQYSLCDELSKDGFSCPIGQGSHSMSWVATIPSDTPSGQLTGKQVWTLKDGRELFCFSWTFNL